MEEVLSRLKALTPEQLREEIVGAGLKCGPITGTTRAIFERKLARTLLESQGGETETDSPGKANDCSSNVANVVHCNSPEVKGSESLTDKQEQRTSSPGLDSPLGGTTGVKDGRSSPVDSPTHYYGVCPPSDSPGREDAIHVYTDKKKALDAVVRMKGARFKVFSCREDAEKFAKASSEGPSPIKSPEMKSQVTPDSVNHSALNVEKANEFKSPRTQDLTAKLRKAVENGDEEAFHELVWGNPRYLIGSADNPTIVQEGCRYNVLHVAAKENQPRMVQLVLETLENPDFLRRMYPDDQEAMLWQRMDYIVDLYLNMPDKTNNETPLHFACKFGCPEVVNVLCSHPATDKQHRNKYNQKPAGVICDRKNKTKEMKQRIAEYLEDRFYVPLLRATDNTLQPVIGGPWSPTSGQMSENSLGHHGIAGTPRDPAMTVTAFAGPLSSAKADEFHRLWKTPPRDRAKYLHGILKSDPERGAERVGRELAHELGYPWAEYWDFLDGFVDLSVEEGLSVLEAYLNLRSSRPTLWESEKKGVGSRGYAGMVPSTKSFDALPICKSAGNGVDVEGHFPQVNTRKKREDLNGTKQTSMLEKSLATASPTPVCNLMEKFDAATSSENKGEKQGAVLSEFGDLNQSDSGIEGQNQSESGIACLDQSKSDTEGLDLSDPGFWRKWQKKERPDTVEDLSISDEYLTADEDTGSQVDDLGTFNHDGRRNRRNSGSTCSSYKSIQSSGWDASSDQSLFFEGNSPTRLDNEVLSALERINIDPQRYPAITKWKSTVVAYSIKQRQSWPHSSSPKPPKPPRSSTPLGKTTPWFSSPTGLRRPGSVLPDSLAYSTPGRPPGVGPTFRDLRSRILTGGSVSV
ncbi:ankyrin repeat and LEM domain-containing protein 2 [Alosa pseudoharengus]|uniref:ankyrin repeat and LEM domain-containing protein 2 n=1 Tax=Alosa pseudoharengus TaxID=34774 RepID=UPI003F8A01B6